MRYFEKQNIYIGHHLILCLTIIVIIFTLIGCGSSEKDTKDNNVTSENTLPISTSIGPFSAEKIIIDNDGNKTIVNQVLITFPDSTDKKVIDQVVGSINGEIIGFTQNPDTYQVELNVSSLEELYSIITNLQQDPRILSIRRHILFESTAADNDIIINGEPDVWAYDKIKISDAWKKIDNSGIALNPVTVAVVDSGLDQNHSEFKNLLGKNIFGANLLPSLKPDCIENPNISDKLKCVELNISDWMDRDGHGTAVSGIIGASNNGVGMNGILSYSKNLNYLINIYRVGNIDCGDGEKNCLYWPDNAIILATTIGKARVVNLSFGAPYLDSSIDIIGVLKYYKALFSSAPNTLFVASAGNDGQEAVSYFPCAASAIVPNVICIGATNSLDRRSFWQPAVPLLNIPEQSSNYGGSSVLNISAPGSNVWAPKASALKENPCGDIFGDYIYFCGTSASAPIVSGVAALLLQINPSLTPGEIKSILVETANPIDSDGDGIIENEGEDKPIGKRINAEKAVDYVISRLPSAKPVITSSLKLLQTPPYKVGQTLTAQFTITNQGKAPITLDVLTIGGRLNNDNTCANINPKPNSNSPCADFTWQRNTTLNPGIPVQYEGTLIPQQAGNYHFFTTYKTSDGIWNTSIPVVANITNTLDIAVDFTPDDTTPPVRSNGSPSGTLSAGTTSTTLSLTTNENATCKYSTTPGTSYASMANTFSTTGGTNHSSNVSGLANGNNYKYYVRCQDGSNNANSDDFVISFSVASTPGDLTPPVRSNGSPTGTLSSGTTQTTLSLTTDENATCRYSTTPGTAYSSMTSTFSTTGGTNHSTNISGLINGTSYNYYIRCQDVFGNANTNDYTISFSVNSSAKERITNGNFSSGTTGWIIDPAYPDFWVGYGNYSRSGTGWYAAGATNNSDGSWKDNAWGQMYQDVDIPSNATTATLSFWLDIATNETTTVANDTLGVWIYSFSSNEWTILAAYSNVNNTGTPTSANYQQKPFDLSSYKGQKVRILFQAKENGNNLRTVFRIDDVSLMADGN